MVRITEEVVKRTKLPVTVKTRLGRMPLNFDRELGLLCYSKGELKKLGVLLNIDSVRRYVSL